MCDCECPSTALLAAQWTLPMVTNGCVARKLSDKSKYSTLVRTVPSYSSLPYVVRGILLLNQRSRIGIIRGVAHIWTTVLQSVQAYLQTMGITVSVLQAPISVNNGDNKTIPVSADYEREFEEFFNQNEG